jgi:hypothetical protein
MILFGNRKTWLRSQAFNMGNVSCIQAVPVLLAFLPVFGNETPACVFEVMEAPDGPVLRNGDGGTEDNKYGFEGGRVLKHHGMYHLFTAEMSGEPRWVKMRLAHWESPNGRVWRRVSTLYESSGEFAGKDPRASFWAPMPYYNDEEARWNLFYVAYRAKPDTKTSWYTAHEGRIWRAVSRTRGVDGLGGLYEDVGVVLEPGPESDAWEGLQGTDSFYAYPVENKWYAFYGSAHTQRWPCSFWGVGLASAPTLAGPWRRCSTLNPVAIDDKWVENPVVSRLPDGTYIALFDGGYRGSFAYTLSRDGVHWEKGITIPLEPKVKKWWQLMRTPLCLIPEGKDVFTVFYTAWAPGGGYCCLGVVKLRLYPKNLNVPGPGRMETHPCTR